MLFCPGPKFAGASVALVDAADADSHGTAASAKSSHASSMGRVMKEMPLRDGQHGVCDLNSHMSTLLPPPPRSSPHHDHTFHIMNRCVFHFV